MTSLAKPLRATGDLDDAVLARLLDLAGPVQGPEILDRLILDLTGVRQGIVHSGGDELALRRQLHVLIGIAGTVGATPLHAAARDLSISLREGVLGQSHLHSLDGRLDTVILHLAEWRSRLRSTEG